MLGKAKIWLHIFDSIWSLCSFIIIILKSSAGNVKLHFLSQLPLDNLETDVAPC